MKSNKEKKEQGRPPVQEPITEAKSGIITDPFGSWTGVSLDNILDTPIQDVDDL